MVVPSRSRRSGGRTDRPSSADRLRVLSARIGAPTSRAADTGRHAGGSDSVFDEAPEFGRAPWQPPSAPSSAVSFRPAGPSSARGWVPDFAEVSDHDHRRPGADDHDLDGMDDVPWDEPEDWELPPEERFRAVRHRTDRWTERWVPEPLRRSRSRLSRRAAVLLTVTGVVAVLVAGWTWWSGRPQGAPVGDRPTVVQVDESAPGTTPVAGAPETGWSSGGPLPSSVPPGIAGAPPTPAAASIWVSVTGRVAVPGLYELPAGARVADALAAAGGLLDQNDLTGINLAQPLNDGQSVVVAQAGTVVETAAAPATTGGSGPAAGSGGSVDLNTADQTALESLPGVGPVMAQAILAWRTDNGPFTSVDQLQEVSGIGPARFAQLAPLVSV